MIVWNNGGNYWMFVDDIWQEVWGDTINNSAKTEIPMDKGQNAIP